MIINCFLLFSATAIYHFVKKIQTKNSSDGQDLIALHNSKIDIAAFWILILSVFSLMLGLMHSFYFIGKAGGIAPNLIFQGIATSLITPVLGIALYIICKTFKGIFNQKKQKA